MTSPPPSMMRAPAPAVVRQSRDFAHLSDLLHDEATLEMHAAIGDVSGKRLEMAAVPGAGRHGLSRALNGCPSNPLYRIAALLLVMRRLGLSKRRAKRIVEWLDELIEQIWGPDEDEGEEPADPAAALEAIRAQQESMPAIVGMLRRMVAAEVVR